MKITESVQITAVLALLATIPSTLSGVSDWSRVEYAYISPNYSSCTTFHSCTLKSKNCLVEFIDLLNEFAPSAAYSIRINVTGSFS